jgi:hypothetical protein
MIQIIFVFIGISFLGLNAFATDDEVIAGVQFDESRELEIRQKVKKRQFPGGKDEGDLKIQEIISTPSRKVAPQAELKAEEPVEE